MSATILQTATDQGCRYTLAKTPDGFLLSCRQRDQLGLLIGPSEWLYRTREAAEAGFKFIMLINSYWIAMARGYPVGDLPARCELAAKEHRATVELLKDQPLIGQEVKMRRLSESE